MTAPWWVRWLAASSVLAALLAVHCFASAAANHVLGAFWGLAVAVAVSIGLVTGALAAAVWQPRVLSYAEVVNELGSVQRAQLGAVFAPGPLPTDPEVLGAAVRAADLTRAYSQRGFRCARSLADRTIALECYPRGVAERWAQGVPGGGSG